MASTEALHLDAACRRQHRRLHGAVGRGRLEPDPRRLGRVHAPRHRVWASSTAAPGRQRRHPSLSERLRLDQHGAGHRKQAPRTHRHAHPGDLLRRDCAARPGGNARRDTGRRARLSSPRLRADVRAHALARPRRWRAEAQTARRHPPDDEGGYDRGRCARCRRLRRAAAVFARQLFSPCDRSLPSLQKKM